MSNPSEPKLIVQPGNFIKPPRAKPRPIPSDEEMERINAVWNEFGPCLAYPKPDGWRLQIHKTDSTISAFTQNGVDYISGFPFLIDAINSSFTDGNWIIDAELIAFDSSWQHLEPMQMPSADNHRLCILDVLYLNGLDVTSFSTVQRIAQLQNAFHSQPDKKVSVAEYTRIETYTELLELYQTCRRRRKEGFDGAILKHSDTSYFVKVLKIKPEETIDAVVMGAFVDKKNRARKILLGVPQGQLWLPITEAHIKTFDRWETIWTICQTCIVHQKPPDYSVFSALPSIWIRPEVVITLQLTEWRPSNSQYLIRPDRVKKCIMREDKGPEDATPLEEILGIMGLKEWPPPSSHSQLPLL